MFYNKTPLISTRIRVRFQILLVFKMNKTVVSVHLYSVKYAVQPITTLVRMLEMI